MPTRLSLPSALAERCQVLHEAPVNPAGEFVLYWMHHAVRAHDNAALDAAILAGYALGLPVLVYQGLGGQHPFNNDRQHTFILEGARAVQAELRAQGIRHGFYLGENPAAPTPLRALAARAALVVVEDYPVPPFTRWTAALARQTPAPVWALDAFCIVPMRSVRRGCERAFQFRDLTQTEFERRIDEPWTNIRPSVPYYDGDLGFAALDLEQADLAELCARCTIDHSIGPVPHTPGGSAAGYARWQRFRARGLTQYAQQRDDALLSEGTSRLSPYLHHGHVSPWCIAREARLMGGAGAEKFLDELLYWRELSYNFCLYHRELDSLAALPNWARATLDAHRADPRHRYTWEELAHARTADPLWNAAQCALRQHGELHNNLRMTWGKALPGWSRDPEEALARLFDLNNRYALDGSDPNSYASLLWCLGALDRPHTEQPVYGTVRTRPTAVHGRRLKLAAYRAQAERPARHYPGSVAVIGAGLAGLAAARTLAGHGLKVQVFDKARGPGGRTSTRRSEAYAFDHGAQYFTVRDARLQPYLASWQEQGLIAPWSGRLGIGAPGQIKARQDGIARYVAVPGMNALAKHLAQGLDLRTSTPVVAVTEVAGSWQLRDEAGTLLGCYDTVLVATPPAQAVPLLAGSPALAQQAAAVRMSPCWAVMAAFPAAPALAWDGLFLQHSPLAWAVRNASKPGRAPLETWVLHATPDWSAAHLEMTADSVARCLLAAFLASADLPLLEPVLLSAHRWRYALTINPLREGSLWDGERRLGACGDWCLGTRMEDALLSGFAAAGRVLGLADRPVDACRAAVNA